MRYDRPFQKPRRMIAQGITISVGRRYVVCVDPDTAEVVQAGVGSWGGGNSFVQMPVNVPTEPSNAFAISPEDSGAAEVWVVYDRDQAPMIMGTTSPSLSLWLKDKSPSLEDGTPHPGIFGPQDLVLANGNGEGDPSALIMGADKSINLLGNGSVRIQIPDGFTVQVTKDGDGGSAVVKFEPTQDAFNRVIGKLNEVGASLQELWVKAAGITSATNPVAQVPNPYIYQPEVDVGEEIASKTLFVPYDSEQQPAVDDR